MPSQAACFPAPEGQVPSAPHSCPPWDVPVCHAVWVGDATRSRRFLIHREGRRGAGVGLSGAHAQTSRESCKPDGDVVTYAVSVPAANPVCPHRSTRRAPNDRQWFLSPSPASSPASVADTDQRADTMLCAL
ncbi:hypothetical protein mRhiFer1_008539 [Rhinolophus ferrumequinum]|uniref:Uncharacterized protein n=1 Tax=Rhinolophus ferrumequinum TaxID=59479 RepID=A0A7J7UX94_RHIFE|nr:hypothetical protein mRhiFer1_008539 [Rhinolophus ferrumequinum]